ncbi:MAG: glycoside hydrolase family 25 protein [Prevotella sp.]|jgi:lysozyme
MNRILIILFCVLVSAGAKAQSSRVECEDTCSHIHGIDLSHYQGNVFWEAVGKTKMAYVYLKATEGGDRIDEKYQQNIDLAHRYGLKVGSYHFYRPRIPQQTQLDNFRAQCRPEDQDLLPMVDIETRSGLSKEEFLDSLFVFLHLMEKTYKQKPLLYTGANFYDANLVGLISDYKVMIAQYTQREPVLKDDLDFLLWQYTGKGRLDGINGYVDKSRFMGRHRLREIRFRHR